MKKNIHPDYHEITVRTPSGKTFKTRSTYGKEGDVLQLDIDPSSHPAWTGGSALVNENSGRIASFNSKFGAINFGGAKKEESAS